MIFLLTDGETEARGDCINLATQFCEENTIIHTFGIGDDCDKAFVKEIAEKG
jgi:hypothetical protein